MTRISAEIPRTEIPRAYGVWPAVLVIVLVIVLAGRIEHDDEHEHDDESAGPSSVPRLPSFPYSFPSTYCW